MTYFWIAFVVLALAALAWWFWPTPAPAEIAPDPLLERAKVLTLEQDTRWPERSGEAKRHQVLSSLVKEFPDRAKRAVSRAIEEALD